MGGVFVVFLGYIFLSKGRVEPSIIKPAAYISIPHLDFMDISGRIITNDLLAGKTVYIQFLDRFSQNEELSLFEQIVRLWGDRNAFFILMGESVSDGTVWRTSDRIILSKDMNVAEMAFPERNKEAGEFYVYDESGLFVATGFNLTGYDDGPKTALMKAIDHDVFSISMILEGKSNVREIHWMRQIHQAMDHYLSEYYLVYFMTKVCGYCDFNLLSLIDRLAEKSSRIRPLGYFYDRYTQSDIDQIPIQLNLNLPGVIADDMMIETWRRYIQRYRESDLNNLLILCDQSGRVLSTFDPNGDRGNAFAREIRRIEGTGS